MDKKRLYRVSAGDAIIAAIVMALSIAPIFAFNRLSAEGAGAHIYEDGRLVKQADLATDGIYKAGGVEIQVAGKKVRVLKSDCPHQICAHTGWISSPAQTIVCVPNKVLVEIRNSGDEQEYNAVSY